jgi:hypothetical protein
MERAEAEKLAVRFQQITGILEGGVRVETVRELWLELARLII